MPEELNNDEILILDESGEFKLLSGGELRPFEEKVESDKSEVGPPRFAKRGQGSIKFEVGMERPIPPLSGSVVIDTGMEEKMLQPPPPVIKKETASFYFHPEDEEEAAKHKVDESALPFKKKYSLDKILIKVIENYKLTLSSELKKRLRTIIFSFLRDTRTLVDTQDILKRSTEAAGLNLELQVAENLLEFLKEIKEKIYSQGGLVVYEKSSFAKATEDKEEDGLPKFREFNRAGGEAARYALPKAASAEPRAHPVQSKEPAISKERGEMKVPQPSVIKSVSLPKKLPQFQRPIKKGAERMADVKKDYKLVGPVDELAILNLETLRRLGETTDEQAKKIIGKINLLAEDSIAKKAAGIKAWRKSPLYKMYLAIGQASMEHNMSVEQVIKEYIIKGRDIITLEEFEAISDINRKLRF